MSSVQAYDTIARFYDLEHDDLTEDLEFYRQIVKDGPVLEVGAGTGRILLALVDSGLDLWGTEPNRQMAAIARSKLSSVPNVHIVEGNVESLPPDLSFEYALLSLNTLWHFTSLDEQLAILNGIGQRLQPEALLIIDNTNPLAMADRGGGGEVRQRFRKEASGGYVASYSAAWDNSAEQLLTVSLAYESTRDACLEKHFADLQLRYVYRPELELLLRQSGFRVRNIYGNYDLEPYGAEAPQLLVVASKRS